MHISNKAFPFPIGSTRKEKLEATYANPETSLFLVPNEDNDAAFFRSLEEIGVHLNEQQLFAVRSTTGPHLMLAGAGSGKTRVLTARTSYILTHDKDVQPHEILLVTFTKKAAQEMKDRLRQMPQLTDEIVDGIVCGTFHSVFLGFLRENGYKQDILANEAYRQVIMKRILRKLKLDELYQPETVLATISTWKNQLIYVEDIVPKNRTESELIQAYTEYEEWKTENGYIDFDDVLLGTYYLLQSNDDYRLALQKQFKYICLDEFQDVNYVQHEIVKCITKADSNVFFTGDEDQLVYSFRNSSPQYILGLANDYPTLKQILLTVNYRSTGAIIGAANRVISFNSSRIDKVSHAISDTNTEDTEIAYVRPTDSQEEAAWLIDHIAHETSQGNRQLGDFAFLYRTHSYARAVIDELAFRKIPFVVYGNTQLFYENRIVKPLISHLRLLVTQDDIDAIADIAPTCYVKREEAYNQAIDFAYQEPDQPVLHSLLKMRVSSSQKSHIVNRLTLLNAAKDKTPVQAIQLFRKAFYDTFFETRERDIVTMQKEYIKETLNELEASASRFESIQDYIQFIDEITNSYEQMSSLQEESNPNAVKLMTIHQSKGLEFPIVCLVGAVDNILPHTSAIQVEKHNDRTDNMTVDQAIEEERRLLYVAMTRAEDELIVSSPKTLYDKEAPVCRFLLEAYC